MGDRMNNMNKMMQNPKSRNMYLTVIALAVVTLGAGFWFATRTAKNNQAPAGAAVSVVPQVQSSPGTSTNPEYNEKVRAFNAQQGTAALATPDKSSIPTLTSSANLSDKSPLDLLEKEAAAKRAAEAAAAVPKEPEIVAVVPVPPPEIVAPPVVAVAPPPAPPAAPVPPPKKYGSMEDYMLLSTLSSSWKIKAPSSEFDYARTKDTTNREALAASQGTSSTSANSAAQATPLPLAKAGTIFNAILETGINSDEPSPVLAKIVSGDLKGARLIGQINRVGEKVVVQFSSISLPTAPSSVKISAVAIDSNTSRTALASDVDRHYFQKYGVMFAAAFLGGYANAIARQNTTTIVDPLGGATIVQGELTPKDINRQAIGNVGKELAEATRMETQNLKPTITVDQGIAIGVLLMDDLIVR